MAIVNFIQVPKQIQVEALEIAKWELTESLGAQEYDYDVKLIEEGEYGFVLQLEQAYTSPILMFFNTIEQTAERINTLSEVTLDPEN